MAHRPRRPDRHRRGQRRGQDVAAAGARGRGGADGRPRCSWGASTPDYTAYHDTEWGKPVRSDDGLYEKVTLEAFQSGLSWRTILDKRPRFREVFAGFDADTVAAYDERDELSFSIAEYHERLAHALTESVATLLATQQVTALAGAFDRGAWSYEDVDLAVLTVPTLLSKAEADAAMRVVLEDYGHYATGRKPAPAKTPS